MSVINSIKIEPSLSVLGGLGVVIANINFIFAGQSQETTLDLSGETYIDDSDVVITSLVVPSSIMTQKITIRRRLLDVDDFPSPGGDFNSNYSIPATGNPAISSFNYTIKYKECNVDGITGVITYPGVSTNFNQFGIDTATGKKFFINKSSSLLPDVDIVYFDTEDLSRIITTQITKLDSLYTKLTGGNFTGLDVWDTSNITSLENTFLGLTTFNLSLENWITSNVTSMLGTFSGCSSFIRGVTTWNVTNVTNMKEMFKGCVLFNDNLSYWVVSNVTDMSGMFNDCSAFNNDITTWITSSVLDMSSMFKGCIIFNQDISGWTVSNVTNMSEMFYLCDPFNQDISGWDVSNVTNMSYMFAECLNFNQPLNSWVVTNVSDFRYMFQSATTFNQDLDTWNITSATSLEGMFVGASSFNGNVIPWVVTGITNFSLLFSGTLFDQDISTWIMSSATNLGGMFAGTPFNQDISGWDVSNVTNFSSLFAGISFDQDISGWDVSNALDMNSMFDGNTVFNRDLNGWITSKVTDMNSMFRKASSFNGDISSWDVRKVKDMSLMFEEATVFNQNISAWKTYNVTDMHWMFSEAHAFNQDISGWFVDKVRNFEYMFYDAQSFNQDISGWKTGSVTEVDSGGMLGMFNLATVFDQDLSCWNVFNIKTEPTDFAVGAAFEGLTAKYPVWGTRGCDIIPTYTFLFPYNLAYMPYLERYGSYGLEFRTLDINIEKDALKMDRKMVDILYSVLLRYYDVYTIRYTYIYNFTSILEKYWDLVENDGAFHFYDPNYPYSNNVEEFIPYFLNGFSNDKVEKAIRIMYPKIRNGLEVIYKTFKFIDDNSISRVFTPGAPVVYMKTVTISFKEIDSRIPDFYVQIA